MTFAPGGIYLKDDVPDKFRINFATALLLRGNVSGCKQLLKELSDRKSPRLQRLRAAIKAWKKTLSIWQRLDLVLGGEPKRVVELDFEPGEV